MAEDAQQQLVSHFTTHFLGGEGFTTITAARQQAALVLGRPVNPGTALAKQVDEAVEGAVVRAAQGILQTWATTHDTYDLLMALCEQHPTLHHQPFFVPGSKAEVKIHI
ncbi:MAG: hypothetical protein IGR92_07820 [Leptolyngbyaceae cyanobacterium T60_A2020_046]|nr:hypothetical protein [Leptolyngbyaceae cyanobacterium T60_A2020_046]